MHELQNLLVRRKNKMILNNFEPVVSELELLHGALDDGRPFPEGRWLSNDRSTPLEAVA